MQGKQMNKYITQEDKEQVMKDTIYREAAINALYNEKRNLLAMDADRVANDVQVSIKVIESLPSADRQGYWIVTTLYVQGEAPKIAVRCSECKRIPLWLGTPLLPTKSGNLLEFCPHCGTRMKGTDDES